MSESKTSRASPTVTRIGSYRLLEPLGSGGMSSVFRAEHEQSGYTVAIKVLPRSLAKNPTLLHRFLREADSVEALEHPNIVSIYDRGFDDGRHYLVLEYVEGSDLQELVKHGGPLPVDRALRVILEAARGLRYAAEKKLVHRDIKPANILLANDGTVKLIDLGLALQAEVEDERVTRDGMTVGTVDYMAPEQARDSRAANIKTDIYSLGCTLFFVLTGLPPFPGGDIPEKLRKHACMPLLDIRQLRSGVPGLVARLIQKMTAKRPEDRFADYDALIEAIEVILSTGLEPDSSGELPYALIAEEDEEDVDFVLGPGVEEGASEADISTTDDADPIVSESSEIESPEQSEPEGELRMADLAELIDDDEPAAGAPQAPLATSARTPLPRQHRPEPRPEPDEPFDPFAEVFEPSESEAGPLPPALTRRRASGDDTPLRDWVVGGALVGLLIALLGFALISLIRMDWEGAATSSPNAEATIRPILRTAAEGLRAVRASESLSGMEPPISQSVMSDQ